MVTKEQYDFISFCGCFSAGETHGTTMVPSAGSFILCLTSKIASARQNMADDDTKESIRVQEISKQDPACQFSTLSIASSSSGMVSNMLRFEHAYSFGHGVDLCARVSVSTRQSNRLEGMCYYATCIGAKKWRTFEYNRRSKDHVCRKKTFLHCYVFHLPVRHGGKHLCRGHPGLFEQGIVP